MCINVFLLLVAPHLVYDLAQIMKKDWHSITAVDM